MSELSSDQYRHSAGHNTDRFAGSACQAHRGQCRGVGRRISDRRLVGVGVGALSLIWAIAGALGKINGPLELAFPHSTHKLAVTLGSLASATKDEQFESVELAFRGETKFILDGVAFRELGQDYGTQNPMYTVRTLPEKLRTPDGRPAFEQWEGGALGALGAQMSSPHPSSDSC